MRLQDIYTQPEQSLRAWNNFVWKFDVSRKNPRQKWRLTDRIAIYNTSMSLHDPSLGVREKDDALQFVYNEIWNGWGAGDSAKPGKHWEADALGRFLLETASSVGLRSNLTLGDILDTEVQDQVREVLKSMATVKENGKRYPWVAASKFLHVHNPKLFPIYDIRHVWTKALLKPKRSMTKTRGVFSEVWGDFGIDPWRETEEFLIDYMKLGAVLFSCADETFMTRFAEWYRIQIKGCEDKYLITNDLESLHAAAFEVTLLGAAYLEP